MKNSNVIVGGGSEMDRVKDQLLDGTSITPLICLKSVCRNNVSLLFMTYNALVCIQLYYYDYYYLELYYNTM